MEFEDAFFQINEYKLGEELGEGSFGNVYIAENVNDHQKYAAKIINTDAGFDGREQMLFLRESFLLHKLDHPSIVKFKGINFRSLKDPTKFDPTIVTEYFPHGSLKDNLEKEKKFQSDIEWTGTKKYITILGISDAMRYLHEHGIVHRDLKPENILADSNYYPRVCDFGLSRCFSTSLSNSMKLSMTGEFGTPMYMAPEILREEEKYGPGVDVYAFGILAYEIVTGKVPYYELGEISPVILGNKVMSGYRPKFTPNVPEKMQALIRKCWSDEPMDRPSFDEIYEALSSDFSFSDEPVDEDEVGMYISTLSDERGDKKGKGAVETESVFASLKNEIEELKEKCRICEILQSTNDDLIAGLNCIHGRDANIQFAISSLERSSERGNRYSSYLLGLLYEQGELVRRDPHKSLSYYEISGNQGNPRGYSNIGCNYLTGRGIEKSYDKAIEYYQKAAEQGDTIAINNLGFLYEKGRGVEQSYDKAIEYYQKAADLGNTSAMYNLGNLFKQGRIVKQSYEKAIEFFQKAADLGDAHAMTNLGFLYEQGRGIRQSYDKAIEYYKKAADLGDATATYNLGIHYERGRGVEQSYDKAIEYYKKAADHGNADAMTNLGFLYEQGRGIKQSYGKAIEYYKKAAGQGNAHAMKNLGFLYKEGRGVEQNYDKAIEYFQRAADQGNATAITCLGIFYAEGIGVEQSYDKAIEYLQRAADQGIEIAIKNLKRLKKVKFLS
ncbi:hypothetical protein M9Y10_008780 [Tritrichomonas musculus]|uniref:Protein kinase domain-containing protein n=1 Tax=Tritrichomonas musculus TaxID=1915356 RepID=A0ABR2IZ22_9EUKA